jgi:hypothetical protein
MALGHFKFNSLLRKYFRETPIPIPLDKILQGNHI